MTSGSSPTQQTPHRGELAQTDPEEHAEEDQVAEPCGRGCIPEIGERHVDPHTGKERGDKSVPVFLTPRRLRTRRPGFVGEALHTAIMHEPGAMSFVNHRGGSTSQERPDSPAPAVTRGIFAEA